MTFPPPPEPTTRTETLTTAPALADAQSPAPRTFIDAERLAEFKAAVGTDRLDALTIERVLAWRDGLLQDRTTDTAKKHLALIRAVLQTAADDGLAVPQVVLDRLGGRGIKGSSGTTRKRRHFSNDEAATLIRISRQQDGRSLDRWGFPGSGPRLQVGGTGSPPEGRHQPGRWRSCRSIWPTEERRLKSDSSCRRSQSPRHCRPKGSLPGSMPSPMGSCSMNQVHRHQIQGVAITPPSDWAGSCGTRQASATKQRCSTPVVTPSPSSWSMPVLNSG